MGNLKTNEQQQVVTQKSSSGDQVIVIQPANPQVVYVPQYNPQVVYVQPAPPPPPPSSHAAGAALVGFTAGIIVGAAINNNNNYYAGPYAWHRPPGAAPYAKLTTPRRCSSNDITMRAPYRISDTTTPATCRISGRPITSRIPPSASRRHRVINRSVNLRHRPTITAAERRVECPIAVDRESGAAAERHVECAIAATANQAQRQTCATAVKRESGTAAVSGNVQ